MIPWYSWLLAVLIVIALIVLIISKFTLLIILIIALAAFFYVSLKSNEDNDKKDEQQKAKKFIRSLPTDNWYRVGDALTRSETRDGPKAIKNQKGKGYSLAMNKDGRLRKNEIAQYGRDAVACDGRSQ